MLYLFVLGKNIGQNPAKHRPKPSTSWAKPSNKLSRIDRYEHVERSIRVFISTVMNMWNGRYKTTFSRFLTNFLNTFAELSQYFHPILSMLSPNYSSTFSRNKHCFNITMPSVWWYTGPYILKPYSYNNTFLTTLFKTTLFKRIFFLNFAEDRLHLCKDCKQACISAPGLHYLSSIKQKWISPQKVTKRLYNKNEAHSSLDPSANKGLLI